MRQFFFANVPEHLYVLGSCKKGALVQQLLLQIMNSIKMGQPHVMQLPTVMFLQMIIGMGLPLAERTVCQDNFFVF